MELAATKRYRVDLDSPDDFAGWRSAVRWLASVGAAPDQVTWHIAGEPGDLLSIDAIQAQALDEPHAELRVSAAFLDLARTAVLHSEPERFALLHAVLHRLQSEPGLIADAADELIGRIRHMAADVRRDIHKMRAFVRFREVEGDPPRFVAFFEPRHHIVRANASFFVDRFNTMAWSILTPELAIHWDGRTLMESPGATRGDAPAGDPVENLWKTYFTATFNPARLKIGAMLKEMPRRYWHNMPETAVVTSLIAGAQSRERTMIASTARARPDAISLSALRDEALRCRRCPLWQDATQTVFGEGPPDAALMLVGEQPGEQEDLAGHPFVGPAGQVLDRALAEAGIVRNETYLTNAVKHFKFERRGRRRIHERPNAGEIQACRWWLEQELAMVKPRIVVALGATAARSVLGRSVAIGDARRHPIVLADGTRCHVTIHPSYLLRIEDQAVSHAEYVRFVEDLARAREAAAC